jgi:hypothetical protein
MRSIRAKWTVKAEPGAEEKWLLSERKCKEQKHCLNWVRVSSNCLTEARSVWWVPMMMMKEKKKKKKKDDENEMIVRTKERESKKVVPLQVERKRRERRRVCAIDRLWSMLKVKRRKSQMKVEHWLIVERFDAEVELTKVEIDRLPNQHRYKRRSAMSMWWWCAMFEDDIDMRMANEWQPPDQLRTTIMWSIAVIEGQTGHYWVQHKDDQLVIEVCSEHQWRRQVSMRRAPEESKLWETGRRIAIEIDVIAGHKQEAQEAHKEWEMRHSRRSSCWWSTPWFHKAN